MCGTTGELVNRFQLGSGDCNCNSKGLGSYGKQIEWNTEPVINTYVYNRDGYWDCNDWMAWHKKVAAKYGNARANEVFMIWWNKQSWYNYAADSCMLWNKTFRDYFNSVGLSLDKIANYVAAPVDILYDTQQSTKDVVKNVADTAVNVSETASNTGSVLKYAVPAALVLGLIGVGFYVHKNYIKGNKQVKIGPATV